MLEVSREGEGKETKTVFRINFSSLDLIQTCKRKAYWALERKLESKGFSPALTFGKAVHKAMEVWYCSSKKSRGKSCAACDDTQAKMLQGLDFSSHGPCPRCSAVWAFLIEGAELKTLPEGDKRSPENGLDILNHYFDERLDDPYEVLHDSHGPIVERPCEVKILGSDTLDIYLHGTIDMIIKDLGTGQTTICDHKTTSFLGKEFYNKIKPNFQNSGYFLLAKEALGIRPDAFMINGVQVAKIKRDTVRQFVKIDDWELEELVHAHYKACLDYEECLRTSRWPMTAPGPCSNYGGCSFHGLCDIPETLRENVVEMTYQRKD
jgi:hypothetical protein